LRNITSPDHGSRAGSLASGEIFPKSKLREALMQRLNDRLLDAVGEIVHQLLDDARREEKTAESKSETFKLMYKGSSQGKREFVKTVFQILREKGVIDLDRFYLMGAGFYLETSRDRWAELKAEILTNAKRMDPS
jgi:hypothetical protein